MLEKKYKHQRHKKYEPNKEIFNSKVSSKISWIEMEQNENKRYFYKRNDTKMPKYFLCSEMEGESGNNGCRIDLLSDETGMNIKFAKN